MTRSTRGALFSDTRARTWPAAVALLRAPQETLYMCVVGVGVGVVMAGKDYIFPTITLQQGISPASLSVAWKDYIRLGTGFHKNSDYIAKKSSRVPP